MTRPPRAARQAARQRLAACHPTPPVLAAEHRAPIGRQALRACRDAHMGAAHGGLVGRTCRTCASYLAAVAAAEPEQRFEPVRTAATAPATTPTTPAHP